MGCDLRRRRATLIFHSQMLFDLLPARARSIEILAAVTRDFRLTALSVFDLVAPLLQMVCDFRAIYGSGVLLRAIEFLRLQRAYFAVFSLCQIKEDYVSVELRGCITVYGPRAVVLEFCRDPISGRLRWEISSKPGLDVSLHLVQRDSDTGSMSFLHTFIAANKRRQRYALRGGKGGIPACAVFHRLDGFALLVHITSHSLVAN